MSAEFDQLVAQFERIQASIQRFDTDFAAMGEMRQAVTDLEAVITSPDGAVTVVAGPAGSIKDIRLTDAAMRRPPQALAAALMSTLQQAVAEAARRQAGIVDNALGDDMNMNLEEQVLETQAELFGTTPEQLRAATEQGTPAAPPFTPPSDGPRHAAPPPAGGPGPHPTAQPGPARRPAPPRRPESDHMDDFSQETIYGDKPRQAPPPPTGRPPKRDDRFHDFNQDED